MLAAVNEFLHGKGLMRKAGTVADATLIAALGSTKGQPGERDGEMHQTKKATGTGWASAFKSGGWGPK